MTFIIAELGINHNGSIEIARKLMDAAKACGADACKFQKRTLEIVYAGQEDIPRESPWGNTLIEQKRALEFGESEYDQINDYSKEIDLPWFASAWDVEALKFLRKYDLPHNKIASAMVTNLEFVKAVAREGKHTFMSTGLCTINDVGYAVEAFRSKCRMHRLTLMHCVGTYPCPESDLNLRMIDKLQELWGSVFVGYSGHETSVSPSVIAVALGAEAIERHLTLDRSMYGSDQAASLEPAGFKSMVDQIRKIPTILGDGVKRVTDGEREVAKKLRYWER